MPPRSVPDPRETALIRHPSLTSLIPALRESHRLAPSAEAGLRPHPGIRHHLFADPAAVKVRSALHLDGPMLCPPLVNRRTSGRRPRPEGGFSFFPGSVLHAVGSISTAPRKKLAAAALEQRCTPRRCAGAQKIMDRDIMKTGRNLRELLEEVTRQAEGKRDYLAPSRKLSVSTHYDGSFLENATPTGEPLPIRDTAHGQIAERVGIPKAYYDRMRENAPALFDENVNHWLSASEDRRLIRSLDGHARAFLFDRYRMLDNDNLATVALPVLMQHGFELVSAEITERKFYLKATTPRIQAEVKPGDVVQAGLVISNSEIGHGTLKIEPLLYFLVCTNGLVIPDASLRRQHVGRHLSDFDIGERYFRQETIQTDDAAFWMKVRDVIVGMLEESTFHRDIGRAREAAAQRIEADPFAVVEVTAKRYRLAETEKRSVLMHFLAGHNGQSELTRYGLIQAVTRASQDVGDYDRATELEQLGGQILELAPSQWRTIAEARGA